MEGSRRSHPADVAGLPLPSHPPQLVDPLTGGPSIFISVSHSKATLASFCLKRDKKVCGSPNSQSDSDTTTSQTTSTSEIRSIHNRNMRRHAPTHHTPMFTLVPRQIHHFLLPIHTRVGVTASAFTNHRHPFHFSLKLPFPTFTLFFLGFLVHVLHLFRFAFHILT